jgi:hypothetical protein
VVTYAFNFTVTTAEQARALVAGPPAWSRRLLRIERLEEEIVGALVAEALRSGSPPVAIPPLLAPKVAALDQLVATHNTYYPIEANLPSDPRTRAVMEGGRPWQPIEVPRAGALLAMARERSGW